MTTTEALINGDERNFTINFGPQHPAALDEFSAAPILTEFFGSRMAKGGLKILAVSALSFALLTVASDVNAQVVPENGNAQPKPAGEYSQPYLEEVRRRMLASGFFPPEKVPDYAKWRRELIEAGLSREKADEFIWFQIPKHFLDDPETCKDLDEDAICVPIYRVVDDPSEEEE